MTWQLHPAREHFPAFAAEWDRLNRELYGSHPMFGSCFIGPLLEYFADGNEQLCIHRSQDEIDGALILHPLGLGRWALFLPAQAQAGTVMLKDARLLETLLPALPGYAWSLDLLSIDPAYSPDWAGLRLPRTVTPHALTMAVALDSDFDSYWQARPKNLIKNIHRYKRRAEEQAGPLAITVSSDPATIRAALARYGQLETTGWKGKTGTAIATDNTQGHFYEKVLSRFAAAGQALVVELYAGSQLAASRLFIRNKSMSIILKTTYNESMAAFAPGRLLLHEVLERAFAEKTAGTIEFYTNASRDQAEWATALRSIPHHQIFRNEMVAALYSSIKPLRQWLTFSLTTLGNKTSPEKFEPRQISIHRKLAELPPAALELLEHSARTSFDHCPTWFGNLQQTVYADDPGIRYYVMNLTGRPAAILPLRQEQHGLVRSIHALSNYYTALYAPILAADATVSDLAPLLQAAIKDYGGAHVLRFAPMDPAAPAYETLLTALRSLGWVPFRFFCFGNWHHRVTGTWQAYLDQREGSLRSTVKRKGKKFAAAGGTLEIITDPAQAETAIADFNRVYSRSWKRPEPYPDFIPGLIRWLANKGWLRLGIAHLDGKPIAAQIWIVNRGRGSIFKLAFDEAFTEQAPGTLLSAHLMEHVIDKDHVQEIDYLIGDDPYKVSWMSRRRERWGIVAYNPRTLVGLALLAAEAMWRLGSRLLSTKTHLSDVTPDTTIPFHKIQSSTSSTHNENPNS